jgi:hypothetical protein
MRERCTSESFHAQVLVWCHWRSCIWSVLAGRTATMGACYPQLLIFLISFPSSFATLSHPNKDCGRHSHITSITSESHQHNACKEQVRVLNTFLLSHRQEAPDYTRFCRGIPYLFRVYSTSHCTYVNLVDLHCSYYCKRRLQFKGLSYHQEKSGTHVILTILRETSTWRPH